MAPFNNRQIGYIQAIAGRQQHTTLICGQDDGQVSSDDAIALTSLPQTFSAKVKTGSNSYGTDATNKSLLLHTWNLESVERCHTSSTVHNDDAFTAADLQNLAFLNRGNGNHSFLNAFSAPVKGSHGFKPEGDSTHETVYTDASATGELLRNPDHISSVQRASTDGYLNSTTVKFRFTLPTEVATDATATHPLGRDHYEFRWIVWRSKRPTYANDDSQDGTNLDMIRQGASFRNPNYDFFMGQTGRKRGFLGYTLNPNLDKEKFVGEFVGGQTASEPTEKYSGAYLANGISGSWNYAGFDGGQSSDSSDDKKMLPAQESKFTVDDLMTMRLNRDDYVIMKDVRFFLGKEHGKSHFEDTLHWDWNDPIDTDSDNVLMSPTLNTKNYRWHFTLLGTSGGPSPCTLNHECRWTTKMESG